MSIDFLHTVIGNDGLVASTALAKELHITNLIRVIDNFERLPKFTESWNRN